LLLTSLTASPSLFNTTLPKRELVPPGCINC
jgi:hypothetical protein